MEQKFKTGNLVRVAEDLGPMMDHFPGEGKEAFIEYSYYEKFGGNQDTMPCYSLLFKNGRSVAWYDEDQLTLIDEGGEHFLTEIKEKRALKDAEESDLKWIVENWPNIRKKPSGATCEKLMSIVGITEPWGKNGEGLAWYTNACYAISMLDEVLMEGMQAVEEFIEVIEELKARAAK